MTVKDAANAARNGPPPHADEFPVDSFRDAARHLRRPFTAAAVKFKVQATWPKDAPTGGLIVAYIDARLAVERLNLLVPHLWHDAYRPVGQSQMWCDLTLDGITRSDVGEGTGKGLVSDALKRAAVKFGIGVSLYAIPKMMLDTRDGCLKPVRTNKGPSLALTPKGETLLRSMYEQWLDAHGSQAFGEPLDHGDVIGAQGDAEDTAATEPPDAPAEAPAPAEAVAGEVTINTARAQAIVDEIRAARMTLGAIRATLKAVGVDVANPQINTAEGILDVASGLTTPQADEFARLLESAKAVA